MFPITVNEYEYEKDYENVKSELQWNFIQIVIIIIINNRKVAIA